MSSITFQWISFKDCTNITKFVRNYYTMSCASAIKQQNYCQSNEITINSTDHYVIPSNSTEDCPQSIQSSSKNETRYCVHQDSLNSSKEKVNPSMKLPNPIFMKTLPKFSR